MKREASYVALGLILAVIVTFAYYQFSYAGGPVANQMLRVTTPKAEVDFAEHPTSVPMLSVTVLVVALTCAYLTYGVTKKRLS